jgi:hypothetical protein
LGPETKPNFVTVDPKRPSVDAVATSCIVHRTEYAEHLWKEVFGRTGQNLQMDTTQSWFLI